MENYKHHYLMDRSKVVIVLIGLALMIIGYITMIGGGATDPNIYPEATLYGTQRTVIAPILILLGLIAMIFAIMKKPKYQKQIEDISADK